MRTLNDIIGEAIKKMDLTDEEIDKLFAAREKVSEKDGGPGSGNFGHGGRPGEIGGSSEEGGSARSVSSGKTKQSLKAALGKTGTEQEIVHAVYSALENAQSGDKIDTDGGFITKGANGTWTFKDKDTGESSKVTAREAARNIYNGSMVNNGYGIE